MAILWNLKQEKRMKRSKNHILYELYLEEANAPELFEKTQRYSLGHIVKFVDIYDKLIDGQTGQQIIKIATDKEIESIEDMDDKDFTLYSSIKNLYRKVTSAEADTLAEVITKIDNYHEKRRNEAL